MPPTSERRAIAQRAALTRSATEVGADISAPARAAFLDSFVPAPKEGVSEAERQRQGRAALRAHMVDLGRRSQAARRHAEAAAEQADGVAADCEALAQTLAHEAI